jgi:hypothetical protein
MVFLEEIRRMKKMLIGTSLYTRERKEEEAGRRCNQAAGDEVPMRQLAITEAIRLNGATIFKTTTTTIAS